jgi:hypothetical protein
VETSDHLKKTGRHRKAKRIGKINVDSMKLSVFKIIILLVLNLTAFTAIGQDKSYISNKHTITKANGTSTNVTNDKKLFFQIYVKPNSLSRANDLGNIWITNAHRMSDYKNVTYEDGFRIYSIQLKESGIYNYWTIDVSNDGQTVLFQVDQNSAIATITMFRYAPNSDNTVLKTVIYYLE